MTSSRSTSPAARRARLREILPWERMGTSVSRFSRSTAVTASSLTSVEFCHPSGSSSVLENTIFGNVFVVVGLVVLDHELPEFPERRGTEHEHLILREGVHPVLAELRALLAPITGPASRRPVTVETAEEVDRKGSHHSTVTELTGLGDSGFAEVCGRGNFLPSVSNSLRQFEVISAQKAPPPAPRTVPTTSDIPCSRLRKMTVVISSTLLEDAP